MRYVIGRGVVQESFRTAKRGLCEDTTQRELIDEIEGMFWANYLIGAHPLSKKFELMSVEVVDIRSAVNPLEHFESDFNGVVEYTVKVRALVDNRHMVGWFEKELEESYGVDTIKDVESILGIGFVHDHIIEEEPVIEMIMDKAYETGTVVYHTHTTTSPEVVVDYAKAKDLLRRVIPYLDSLHGYDSRVFRDIEDFLGR